MKHLIKHRQQRTFKELQIFAARNLIRHSQANVRLGAHR